jgi:hypothetical protein
MFTLIYTDLTTSRTGEKNFETQHGALTFAQGLERQKCVIVSLKLPDGSTLSENRVTALVRQLPG